MLTPAVREYSVELIKKISIFYYHHNNEYSEVILLEELLKIADNPEKYLKEHFNNSGWVKGIKINGNDMNLSFDYQENGVKVIENFGSDNEKEGFITYKRIADVLLEEVYSKEVEKMEDKLLVAEVNYVGIGSYTLLPSEFKSCDLEMMKEEVVSECLDGMGAIDEENYSSEIEVKITFKNMSKKKIENMQEFKGF